MFSPILPGSKRAMKPAYGVDTIETCLDTDFTYKSKVSNMIRHDTLPVFKHPCIIVQELILKEKYD